MRSTGNFHPEWGYLVPARSLMRTARVALIAAAIGATAGAVATRALVTNAPTVAFAARVMVTSAPVFTSPAAAALLAKTTATAAANSGPSKINPIEHWRYGCAFCAAFALPQSLDSSNWASPAYSVAREDPVDPAERPIQRNKSSSRKRLMPIARNRTRLLAFTHLNENGRNVHSMAIARRSVFTQPRPNHGVGETGLFPDAIPGPSGGKWSSASPAAGVSQGGYHAFGLPYRHYSVCGGNHADQRSQCSVGRDVFAWAP